MIAVDTNLLVYAHREDSPHHARASEVLSALAVGRAIWAIPWPCLHEFLAVVTHSRIYRPPTSTAVALQAVDALVALPTVHLLSETSDHHAILTRLVSVPAVVGPKLPEGMPSGVFAGPA